MSTKLYRVVRTPQWARASSPTRYLRIHEPSGEFTWPTKIEEAGKFTLVEGALLIREAARDDNTEYYLEPVL